MPPFPWSLFPGIRKESLRYLDPLRFSRGQTAESVSKHLLPRALNILRCVSYRLDVVVVVAVGSAVGSAAGSAVGSAV